MIDEHLIKVLHTTFLNGQVFDRHKQCADDLIQRGLLKQTGVITLKGKQLLRTVYANKCCVPFCRRKAVNVCLCRTCNHYYYDNFYRGEVLIEATYEPSPELIKLLEWLMRYAGRKGLNINSDDLKDNDAFYAVVEEGLQHDFIKFIDDNESYINITHYGFNLPQMDKRPVGYEETEEEKFLQI